MTLPEPPRTVRLGAVLATWWPFGVAAALALFVALAIGAVRLAGDDFRLPRDDWRLDAAPALGSATADVVAVAAADVRGGLVRVRFRVAWSDGTVTEEHGWLPAGATAAGRRHAVEHLPGEPRTVRLVGGSRALATGWLPEFAGRVLLPAAFAVLLWLARAWRTYVLLRLGTAVPSRVVAVRRLPALPFALAEYAFAAADGSEHIARQLVRVEAADQRAAWFAIHDPDRPARSRLVTPGDVGANG